MLRIACAAAVVIAAAAALGEGGLPSDFAAYVDVRPGAHMFYRAYKTTSASPAAPLVWWLQGGPGAGGSGYGDYAEMGPLDTNLQPRNSTWVRSASMVYIDQPVGAGFSYVDDMSLLTTNISGIVSDLLSFATQFFEAYPDLQTTPFYIFSESYGGKMNAAFSVALLAAIDAGQIKCAFKGLALGDSWVSGISYVNTWGGYLKALSIIDNNQLVTQLGPAVAACDADVAAGQWEQATNDWGNVEGIIDGISNGVDFYNVLLYNQPDLLRQRSLSSSDCALAPPGIDCGGLSRLYARHVQRRSASALGGVIEDLMNGPVRALLKIIPDNVTWGGQSGAVFSAQSGDFMRPVVDSVDALLKDGRVNVTVYQGQLDLICLTAGTQEWMNELTWSGLPAFLTSTPTPLYSWPGTQETGGFVKQSGSLAMYTINNAGHLVPADNPDMALVLLESVTQQSVTARGGGVGAQ